MMIVIKEDLWDHEQHMKSRLHASRVADMNRLVQRVVTLLIRQSQRARRRSVGEEKR